MTDAGLVFAIILSLLLGTLGIFMVRAILRRRKYTGKEAALEVLGLPLTAPQHFSNTQSENRFGRIPMRVLHPANLSSVHLKPGRLGPPVRASDSLPSHILPQSAPSTPPRPISKDNISRRIKRTSRRLSKAFDVHFMRSRSYPRAPSSRISMDHRTGIDSTHFRTGLRPGQHTADTDSCYSGVSCPSRLHSTMLHRWSAMSFPLPPGITSLPRLSTQRASRKFGGRGLEFEVSESNLGSNAVDAHVDHCFMEQECATERMLSKATAEPILSLLEALAHPWGEPTPATSSYSLELDAIAPTLPSIPVSPFFCDIADSHSTHRDSFPPTPRGENDVSLRSPSLSNVSESSCNISSGPTTPPPQQYYFMTTTENPKRLSSGMIRKDDNSAFAFRRSPQDLFRFTGSRISRDRSPAISHIIT